MVQKEHLIGPDNFINFNSFTSLEKKRHPIRHTYIVRGLNSLAAKNESHRTFVEQYEHFIWTNIPYERGLQVFSIKEAHYLPIPYPRYLTPKAVSQDGLLKAIGDEKPDFVQQMPLIMKLLFDGTYMGHVKQLHSKLRNISVKTRYQLLRENDSMEEDEWREKVENLKNMYENYQNMALSNDPDSESEEDDEDY